MTEIRAWVAIALVVIVADFMQFRRTHHAICDGALSAFAVGCVIAYPIIGLLTWSIP